jgi:hypothetical protein
MPAGWIFGRQISRKGEPATADVDDVDVPRQPLDERRRRVHETSQVPEPDQARIVGVDESVAEAVEIEQPLGRVAGVDDDLDAVVTTLDVARGRYREGGRSDPQARREPDQGQDCGPDRAP